MKLSKVVVFPEVTIKTLEIFKVDVVTEPVQNKIRKTESEYMMAAIKFTDQMFP